MRYRVAVSLAVTLLAADLPPNFHPAATGARSVFTPIGAGDCVEHVGEPRCLNPALDHAPLAVDEFQFDKAGQELDVIAPLGRT